MEYDRIREERRIRNRSKACMIDDGDRIVCIDSSLPLLGLIGRKYTMMILGVVGNTGNRKNFNEILRDIPYSSSTILSKRIKELIDFNLIRRNAGPDGVTYSLTEYGQSVRTRLLPLLRLAEESGVD